MKKLLTILLMLPMLGSSLIAQNLVWAKAMGGAGNDGAYAMVTDGSGNVYTTGRFSGTADFNPGTGVFNLTSAGNTDIFLSKLDASGNFVWAMSMGGSGNDGGIGIALDPLNNILITGYFEGTADFDPGTAVANLTASGGYDAFVLRIDMKGFYSWAVKLGGTGYDMPGGIAVSQTNGYVYTTGSFSSGVDFDPGPLAFTLTSKGNTDVFVNCLNNTGNFVYAQSLGSTDYDDPYSIKLDASDDVLITGEFVGTVDFDPGNGITNMSATVDFADIFILKTDNTGKFTWVRSFEGKAAKHVTSVTLDGAGNIYTTGSFNGTVDFNPAEVTYNLTSTGYTDAFISKLNASGMFVWARSIQGAQDAIGMGITTDVASNVYITGYFNGTADFNPGPFTLNITSAGNTDAFVMQLNASGSLVGAHRTGGTGYDYGEAIIADGTSRCITAGIFAATVDFDPGVLVSNLTAAGSSDIFITKQTLSAVGILIPHETTQIVVSPNPAMDHISIQATPEAYYTIIDMTGKTIMEGMMPEETVVLNISTLTPGVYLLHVEGKTTRLIKQ